LPPSLHHIHVKGSVAFTEIPERELRGPSSSPVMPRAWTNGVAFTEIPERELRVYPMVGTYHYRPPVAFTEIPERELRD
jgi:hypothetical protein